MATTDEKDILAIDRVTGDEAPITREYPMLPWAAGSPYAVNLTKPEGFVRDTRPDLIGFDTLDRMRRHAPIKAALILIKMPVLSRIRNAQAECEDPDIQAFVQHEVIDSGLLYKLAVTSMRAVEFGVAFHEKRWTAKELHIEYDSEDPDTGQKTQKTAWDGIAHTYKEIREVNPASVTQILRRTDARGYKGAQADESFDGFEQGTDGDGKTREVDTWRAFVYTHDKEFGNMWGQPRDRDAYPYYMWAQFLLKCWMAWVERKVIPPNKSFFPMGKSTLPNGTQIDNQTIALMVGKAVNNSSTIAIPSTNISKDARGTSGRRIFRDWDLEELPRTDVTSIFSETKQMLDTDMFRAMFTPPRTFDSSNSDGGLFSTDAEAHFDVFLSTEDGLILDFGTHAEDYTVQPLVVVNFGIDAPICRIKIPGLSDEQRQMLASTFNAVIVNPDNQARIDFDALAKSFSVPLKELEEDNGNAGIDQNAIPGSVPSGNEATGKTLPDASQDGANPAVQPANGTGSANPAPGQPSNLVLDDDLEHRLALEDLAFAIELAGNPATAGLGGFNASRWTITPNSASPLGYTVIDNQDGRHLGGYAAMQVIKSYEKQAETAGKKAASAQKSAQSKAAAAAKKAASIATTAQHKADAAAAKAQREQTAAAKRAEAQAKRDAAAANRQAAQAQKAHDHIAQSATTATHNIVASQAKANASANSATTGAARTAAAAEAKQLAGQTKSTDVKTATKTLAQAGWQSTGDYANQSQALTQASDEAASDPLHIYTVTPINGGFIVAKKPIASVASASAKTPAAPKAPKATKVKAEDDNAPNADTTKLIVRAAKRIGRIFNRG